MSTITIILDEDKAALVNDYVRLMRTVSTEYSSNEFLALALATGIESVLRIQALQAQAIKAGPSLDHFPA